MIVIQFINQNFTYLDFMNTETSLSMESQYWALLDQLAVAFVETYDPALSCSAPFSLLINSSCRNRINQWMEMQEGRQAQAVLSDLLQQLTCKSEVVAAITTPEDKRLQKIFDYIHNHYSREIRLPKLALHVGMSDGSLCRFFKKATGEHFTDYVNKIRVDYAVRQLLETEDSVSEIGYSCGFNTIDYFIRIFKKLKGCTPGAYRKK